MVIQDITTRFVVLAFISVFVFSNASSKGLKENVARIKDP